MKRLLETRTLLPIIGFATALLFGTLVYPILEPDFHASLSTDGHDRLGLGLYHDGTVSFYPSTEKSVMRGPVYPVIVAAAVAVGGEANLRWSILVLQGLMHALTVLVGALIAGELTGGEGRVRDRTERITGLLIALHPFPLWYLTRVMVEPVSILLCTTVMLFALRFARAGRLHQGLALGIATGLAILTKSTYLLLLPLLPILLGLSRPRSGGIPSVGGILLCTLLLPSLIVLPWTLRNVALTGSVIPVHILDGVNFAVGDFFVRELSSSPLGYAPIVERFKYPGLPGGLAEIMEMTPEESVAYDRGMRRRSLEGYAADPLFLGQKIALQSITFWTIGSRPIVTIVIGGMQLVLLGILCAAAIRLVRKDGPFGPMMIPVWSLVAYWLAHTPLYAIARFSVVWVPVMVAYGVWWWMERSVGRKV